MKHFEHLDIFVFCPFFGNIIIHEQNRQVINLVFEFGQMDLAQLIKSFRKAQGTEAKKQLDENTIRYIWREILQCVQVCHMEKILHLDLKPSNFVFVNGTLKIIDFGIAKAVGNNTTNVIRDAQVIYIYVYTLK